MTKPRWTVIPSTPKKQYNPIGGEREDLHPGLQTVQGKGHMVSLYQAS